MKKWKKIFIWFLNGFWVYKGKTHETSKNTGRILSFELFIEFKGNTLLM